MHTRHRVLLTASTVALAAAATVSSVGPAARTSAPRARVAAPAAAPATVAYAPVQVTLSGLDGSHGAPIATVSTPAATAAAPAPTAPARHAAKPLTEGITVQQVGGPAKAGGLHAHSPANVTDLPNFVDLVPNGTSTFTQGTAGSGGMRYVYANFKVRWAQSCSTPDTCTAYGLPSSNVTLVAAETSRTLSQTAVSGIKLFDGTTPSNAAALATQMVPTDGIAGNDNQPAAQVHSQDGLQSLQVFTEDETSAIPTASGVTSLLPYGYVVRNNTDPGTRALPASPAAGEYDGSVTIAVAFPTQPAATQNPFSISLVYQPVQDANTRVTQSLEDDDQAGDLTANARAAALGSTDLAVLGKGHTTATDAGDPICTVRTAGTRAAPTAYLVNDGANANLASLPYNLSSLSPTDVINAGFCQSIQAGGGTFSSFVISGSQSGPRTNSGFYSGAFTGGNVLSFQPGQAFFTGERVSMTVTGQLSTAGGQHPSAFVGQSYVGGAVRSLGQFDTYGTTATGGGPVDEAVADFDGDGIPDVAVLNGTQGSVNVFYGNGDGTFGAPVLYSVGNAPSAIAAGDLNGDHLPDLVVTNATDNTVSVLLAGDDRTFRQAAGSPMAIAQGSTTGTNPRDIVLADFNHDGQLDLATADQGSSNVFVAYGKGDGTFGGGGFAGSSGLTGDDGLAVLDWNGDGVPDLAVAGRTSSSVSIYQTSASGNSFTAVASFATGTAPGAMAAGDFNGDGHPDVAVANSTQAAGSTVTVGYGNGSSFTAVQGLGDSPYGDPLGIAAVNDRGPGKPDLAVTYSSNNALVTFTNQNTRTSTAWGVGQVEPVTSPEGLSAADLNGDGAGDLVTVSNTGNQLVTFLSDGNGSLAPALSGGQHLLPLVPARPNGEAVGDFNDDGHLDVAIAGETSDQLDIDLGGANGAFTGGATITANLDLPFQVLTADFDGDGVLDLAVVNLGGNDVSFYKGNGDGTFTARGTIGVGTSPERAVVGDFNGDGRPDLAVTNVGGGVTILLDNGTFGFTASTLSVATGSANGVDTADFNGDGHLDLAVADAGNGQVDILLGDGNGGFTLATKLSTGGALQDVVVADFNGDGRADVAAADSTGTLHVVYASPAGGFGSSVDYPLGGSLQSMAVGDLNGDGLLDLVVTDYSVTGNAGYVTVLQGSPSGLVVPPHSRVGVAANPSGIALGDFLGTHRLAMLTANYLGSSASLVPQRG